MPRTLATVAAAATGHLALPSRRQMGLRSNRRARRATAAAMPAMPAKMMCLWKPAQSGKTRTIMDMIRDHEDTSAHLNIIICSKIRLLVSQTTARMSRDLFTPGSGGMSEQESGSDSGSEYSVDSSYSDDSTVADDRIEGNVFSWMSGTGRVNTSTGELADRIKEDEVTMVVCCAHKRRFKYLNDLLTNLEKSRHFTKRVSVWIDEADVSVRMWSARGADFTQFKKVDRVCLVSATFNSVVRTYGRIKVMGFAETHPPCYVPLRECNVVTHECKPDPATNLAAVLAAHPEICVPGTRLFAPAFADIASHDAVVKYLLSKGFAVMILNGQRKCILCPDGRPEIQLALRVDPTNPDEIGKVLPALYADHNLGRWPFAVTGQLCLGRGITFQSEAFMFDYGIIPNIGDAAAAYQCIARLLGNIRDFKGFKVPTVFMSDEMKKVTYAQEKVAIMIAKKVMEKGWADVGAEEIDFVIHDNEERYEADCRGPATERDVPHRIYDTEERARGALKELEPSYAWRSRSMKEGFYQAAVGGEADTVSIQHVLRNLQNLTGGKGASATHTRYVPCYRDTKDPSTLLYVVLIPASTTAARLDEVDAQYPRTVIEEVSSVNVPTV